jgi:thymidylate synthase (FAD)
MPDALRMRDINIKQGSSEKLVPENNNLLKHMHDYYTQACVYYNKLLAHGVCPEQARMILPQAMYTEYIETASLAGYARLFGLRADPAAQKEIQEYAKLIATCLAPCFPVSWEALTVPKSLAAQCVDQKTHKISI